MLKKKKTCLAEIAYRAFCDSRNLTPHLPLDRARRVAWGAFAGAASAGAGAPLAWSAYRAAYRAPVGADPAPTLRDLRDGELRALRAARPAVRL